MDTRRPAAAHPALTLLQLRVQLEELVHVCDLLADHLERERDLAARRRELREFSGLQQALLQVTRVRNDVRSGCRDLDALALSQPDPKQPLAA
jgi:hypothetical protein